mgnify:CR=1 FL=1
MPTNLIINMTGRLTGVKADPNLGKKLADLTKKMNIIIPIRT